MQAGTIGEKRASLLCALALLSRNSGLHVLVVMWFQLMSYLLVVDVVPADSTLPGCHPGLGLGLGLGWSGRLRVGVKIKVRVRVTFGKTHVTVLVAATMLQIMCMSQGCTVLHRVR